MRCLKPLSLSERRPEHFLTMLERRAENMHLCDRPPVGRNSHLRVPELVPISSTTGLASVLHKSVPFRQFRVLAVLTHDPLTGYRWAIT